MKRILLVLAIILIVGCVEPTPDRDLKIEVGEIITATVESEKNIFTGYPPFEMYQLVDNKWHLVDVYGFACAPPCTIEESEICDELPIVCAPLPEDCRDFDPFIDKFEWDKTVYKVKSVDCPELSETRQCSYTEKAGPGKYKLVFRYSEKCADETFFEAEENNVQEIEKEFELFG